MKVKILLILFLCIPFLTGCSLLGTKSEKSAETGQPAPGTERAATAPKSTSSQAQSSERPITSSQVASAPLQSSSSDDQYVIDELSFEVKKLSAELKHLRSQLEELQANSQMWMNPLAMYNKEIITDNGTSIFGKIVYQDDKIVKVETLIGFLVLEKENIVRVITNIPEEPAQKYLPEELASDVRESSAPATPQPTYISKSDQPAQAAPSKTKSANCVLVGDIKERKDRSGNTIFSGEVKNIGTRRADFVKVNFIFRKNWSGDTKTKTAFVEGTYFTFEDSGITTNNTLLPGASGNFELIIPKSFGTFIGYSYTIEWEQYQ